MNILKIIFIFLLLSLNSIVLASEPVKEDLNFNSFTVNQKSNQIIDNPFEGMGNLYEQIFDSLNGEYELIGKLQAQKILANKLTVTGGLNSVGFSYKKPFLDFGISLDRNLAPDLYSNTRWIVTDTLTIHIDASKVINKLKQNGSIDITEKNLAMFAGIVFERKFVWRHFAQSYDIGLSTHFEKLFFPFIGIRFNSIQKLEANEIITKEDSISINAGGFVSAPLYTGVSFMGGVLAKFQKMAKMELTRKANDEGAVDSLLLSYEKSKSVTAGASVSIQADFLKILRMTLLSYDFSYKLDSSYQVYTKFPMNIISELNKDDPIVVEIQKILKTKEPTLEVISPYIISEEKKIAETITHKYNFLLLGGSKSSRTQQIEVLSQGRLKTFFRHNYEKLKFTENALSRLISSFLFRLFNSDIKAANTVADTKKVVIEYDSLKNLLENHEDLNLEDHDSQKLSLTFQGNYLTNKTTGISGRKYKERARFILERYSGVDQTALTMLDNNLLIAPFEVEGMYQVNTEGIRYFNSKSVDYVFDNIDGLCDEKPRNKFINFRSLFDICKRSLQNDYMDYLKDLSHEKISSELITQCEKKSKRYIFSSNKKRAFLKNCLSELSIKESNNWTVIPLWPLKSLSQNLVNNIDSKIYYYNLFGLNNVFFHGSFNANTVDGSSFVTYFHEGAFKGLGVVDNYMRKENLRAPASVVVDQ